MAYDEGLAQRIRETLAGEEGVTERAMFGGLGFMIHGNMAVAAGSGGAMMLRIDPGRADELVGTGEAERTVMRGRAMDGWLNVDPAALEDDSRLGFWVEQGASWTRSLPPK